MKKLVYLLVWCFILLPTLVSAKSEGFKVSGEIIFNKSGPIYIKLTTEEEFDAHRGSKFQSILKVGKEELEKKIIPFAFENIPEGTYAIKCFQDVNGNGKLDMGKFGPKEPWGNYHEKRPLFRGPKFKEIQFEVKENITDIAITLK